MTEPLRLFIAIELSADLLAALAQQQEHLRQALPGRSLRWTNAQVTHLTLKFLGDTPPERLLVIQDNLVRACRGIGPFEIRATDLGCFPNVRRPAVLWIGVYGPGQTLLKLRDQVERTISPLGYPGESRPFHPHLTLARIARGAPEAEVRPMANLVNHSRATHLGSMTVDTVSLMRSELKPSGAQYTRLFEVKL